MNRLTKQILIFSKLPKRHLIVLFVSLLSMAIVWFFSASVMLLFDADADWKARILVFTIALFPAFFSQLGLLLSIKLENNGTIFGRIFIFLYLLAAVFVMFFILADVLKWLSQELNLIPLFMSAGLAAGVFAYTMQTAFLLKAILNGTNENRDKWRKYLR